MLHVTNGSCAITTLRKASITGDMLAWDDVLHEGPVPDGLDLSDLSRVRADFIAACGWAHREDVRAAFAERDGRLMAEVPGEETVLWFEHDLYDQLQLLQLLDLLASSSRRVTLVCEAEYLGTMAPERAGDLFCLRKPVTQQQFATGRFGFAAFRASDPAQLRRLLEVDTQPLPFLHAAMLRLLQEYPAVTTGLGRTEQQILSTVADGATTPATSFSAWQKLEPVLWLGDSAFCLHLANLLREPVPLLRFVGDRPPLEILPTSVMELPIALTAAGEAVLAGRLDSIAQRGIDRWIGGVHLSGQWCWRWDEDSRNLVGPR